MARRDYNDPVCIPGNVDPGLQLVPVLTAAVAPTKANSMMKVLASHAPLQGLQHLKRVRKVEATATLSAAVEIILCPASCSNATGQAYMPTGNGSVGSAHLHVPATVADDCKDESNSLQRAASGAAEGASLLATLPEPVSCLVRDMELQPKLVQVPSRAPRTRQQWQEWTKIWPITWRQPDADPTSLTIKPSLAECAEMRRNMERAWALLDRSCFGGRDTCNAAVIVDPLGGGVIAEGVDSRDAHPLKHAAMEAIASAALRDRTLWPEHGMAPTAETRPDSCNESAGPSEPTHKRQRLELDDEVQTSAELKSSEDGLGHQDSQAANPADAIMLPKPYICTGFDCYLVREPCAMCAMALLHSRVRRVVYCVADKQGGALGGSFRLHGQRTLNHHYEVFHMPLHRDA